VKTNFEAVGSKSGRPGISAGPRNTARTRIRLYLR
jgi:hypothetical protein